MMVITTTYILHLLEYHTELKEKTNENQIQFRR